MAMLKAVRIITGLDPSGRPVTIEGLEVETLHADPASFSVQKDTSTIPPRVKLALTTALTDLLASASEDAEPETLALRTNAAELKASTFIGESVQAADETIAIAGPSGLNGVEVAEDMGQAKIGFLGATPVFVQPVDVLAADPDKLNDVITALLNLGLITPA